MTKMNFMMLFLLLLIFGVYWKFFLPGPRVAIDFPLVSDNQLKSMIDLPRVWSEGGAEGLGEYSAFFLWAWPLSFITGILSNLGVTFPVLEKFFLLVPTLIIGAYGILKLIKNLNLSSSAGFICALFYLTNTYILLLVDGGQLSIGLTYAFFPISFLAMERSLTGRMRERILAGIAVSVLGFLDIRFVYILLILCLIRFFYQFLFLDKKRIGGWILGWLKTGLVAGTIVLGLNFYWLLPLLKDPTSATTYSFFTQFSSSNLNLGHPLFLISPHWYKNIFGVISSLKWEFVLIPILVFLAPILRPKNQSLGFWLLVSLISAFLAKGDAQPFSSFYRWLFKNIPYFSIFQDSTKFFVLVALSYTVLLGFTLEEIKQKIKAQKLKTILFLFTVLYLLFLARPVWLGWMNGTFSQSPYQKEYQKLGSILQQDTNFSRVFWIPSLPSLGYLSQNHPRVEATRLVQKRPFAIGTRGSYEIFNFLREAPYMSEIFSIGGIGYIVYPPLNPRRDNMHPDNIAYYYSFSDQLSKLPWLERKESQVPIWKVRSSQDKFFVTPNLWWVIGSDSIYNEATQSAKLKLSKNALIFSEEHAGLGPRIDELPQAEIVLNNKTIIDIAATFIKSTSLIFPAKQLDFDPDKSGWWKRETADLIRWRDFLKTKYGIDNQDFDLGGGWAVGEGNLRLEVGSEKWEVRNGNIILARVLESTRSGSLKFYQDDDLIGEINTQNEGNNVRWFEVGEIQKDGGSVIVESEGDINIVNALALLEKDVWESLKNKADGLQNRIVDFDESLPQDSGPKVTYKEINSTKYKVNITNLTKPSFLVFSQTYHPLWKLDDKPSVPVYSLLNGFRIDKNGEHVVEFEPQRYVYSGLVISVVMFSTLILLLLRKRS